MNTMLCEKCQKNRANRQIGIVAYEEKSNSSEKSTTKIIGAVDVGICERCLAKIAWKQVFASILNFIISLIIIYFLAWLISKVFRLSWIGGGLIALRLLFEMIKGIAGAARNAAEMGSTAFTEKNYQKKGFIPQEDFFWIAEDCGSVFEDGRLNLNNSIGEISIISYEAVERGLKVAPDNEETAYVRQSAALCLQAAHENGHSNFEPKIIKTMLFPIAIGFVIIASLFVSMLVILEGFEQSLTPVAIIGFFMAILGVCGTVLLWKKKLSLVISRLSP